MSTFHKRVRTHTKKEESMTHTQEEHQATICERAQMSCLIDMVIKEAIMNMFKELKGTRLKKEKENVKTILYQLENKVPNGNTAAEKYSNPRQGGITRGDQKYIWIGIRKNQGI